MRKSNKRQNKQQKHQYNDTNQTKGLDSFKLNQKQKCVNNMLIEYPLVFVQGCAGTGKTTGILHHFAREYIQDKTKKIVIIRTPVEAGPDKIGALPGDKEDKLEPHFKAYEKILTDFIGGKFKADFGKRIEFMIPNYALGITLDDSLVLIDEAQQITPDIMKLLLERLGQNTVCAVVGDHTQMYAKDKNKRNGLTHAISKCFVERERSNGDVELEPRSTMISSFKYDPQDNVRSDISREIVKLYS